MTVKRIHHQQFIHTEHRSLVNDLVEVHTDADIHPCITRRTINK